MGLKDCYEDQFHYGNDLKMTKHQDDKYNKNEAKLDA